jgi:hypothetical protein
MAYDNNYGQVVLLLDGESLTDTKGHTVTAYGNAAVSATQFKYGTQSYAFDGSGDYLSVPDSADFEFGNGDFTIELFARLANVTSVYSFLSHWTSGQQGWWVVHESNALAFYYTTNGSTTVSTSATSGFSTNTWYHIAVCRNGADLRLFVNGTQVGSTYNISTATIFDSSAVLEIGANSAGTYGAVNGYLDEIRITKGFARYTATFTAPTAAFPTSSAEEDVADTASGGDTALGLLSANGTLTDTATPLDASSADLIATRAVDEAVSASEETVHDVVQWFYESIAAVDTTGLQHTTSINLTSTVAARDLVVALFEQLVSEQASGADTWYLDIASIIAEVSQATGIVRSVLTANAALAEIIVALEMAERGMLEQIGESAAVADTVAERVAAVQRVLDTATGADSTTSYLIALRDVTEVVTGNDTVALWQSLNAYLEEGAEVFVSLRIDGEVYTGWVLNTKNNAVSEYQGLRFNSTARIGNRYFGATDTGIYEMTGTKDAGADIATYIQTGLMDFGSSLEKSVPYAYLGCDAEGRVALGVSVSEKASVRQYWYEVTSDNEAVNNLKIPIGKGLKGRYWKFEIASDALQSFDAVTLLPATLSRRV